MIKKIIFASLLLVATLSSYADSHESVNDEGTTSEQPTLQWNLDNADIRNLINLMAQKTDKTFLIDPPGVTGKVTMISNTPIPLEESYAIFLTILQANGYSAIPDGNIVRIMPSTKSSQFPSTFLDGRKRESYDVVTEVLTLTDISASQILPTIQQHMPQGSFVQAVPATNAIVMVGPATSINYVKNIIKALEPNYEGTEYIPLKYAQAMDIIVTLHELQNANAHRGLPLVSFAPDTVSNGIFMKGGLAQEREDLRKVITQLDEKIDEDGASTQIFRLHYLKAEDLIPTLEKIVETTNMNMMHPGLQPASVVAENTSNSIIVNAPAGLMRTLRNIINELDKRPPQVLVEAAIIEITDTNLQKLGIQWGQVSQDGTIPKNFANGMGIIHSGSIQAVITAISTSGDTNILSTPNIVVSNNQEAALEIGKTVSIQTGSQTNSSGNPVLSFSREKVGLELKVTPQINHGDAVHLIIEQINNSLAAPEKVDDVKPVVNNSSITTTVVVDDDSILVLGGLISYEDQISVSKTPILGDIPLVGELFKNRTTNINRKNLLIFIKPKILRSAEDNRRVSNSRYQYMRNQARDFKPSVWFGEKPVSSPGLAPWPVPAAIPKPFSTKSNDNT